ncbi:major facilitator superfamily domain-containing protein [Hyaloraphidium curvatum]|nr:major facilitator superfamily domain-containing protein [Hyaloraphidium curvatum]
MAAANPMPTALAPAALELAVPEARAVDPAADDASVISEATTAPHAPEASDLDISRRAKSGFLDPEGEFAEDVLPHDDIPLDDGDAKGRQAELEDPTIVKWAVDDPQNPHHWSLGRRWAFTIANSLLVLNATLASSAPSGVARTIMAEFGATQLQATMLISLFVLGYVLGPLVWAPASEVVGRRPVNIISGVGLLAFNIGCVFVTNIGEMLALRLIAGIFAAASLTNAGGVIGDIFLPAQRAYPMTVFSLMPFLGPVLGPVISGYMGISFGWRSVFIFLSAFSGASLCLAWFVPETYHPVLLTRKAKQIRKATGKTLVECRSPVEHEGRTVTQLLLVSLTRPLKFLFTELIVAFTSIYGGLVYGVLYLLFTAYPFIFTGIYHFNAGETGLAFLGVWVGSVLALFLIMPFANKKYVASRDAEGRFSPEARLWASMIGGPIFVVGLFWLAWTCYPSIHWIVPALAGIPLGAGVLTIFMSLSSYVGWQAATRRAV